MSTKKRKTKLEINKDNLTDDLNQVSSQTAIFQSEDTKLQTTKKSVVEQPDSESAATQSNDNYDRLFEKWDEQDFTPQVL